VSDVKARPASFEGPVDVLFDLQGQDDFLRSLGMIAVTWAQLEMVLSQYYTLVVLGEDSTGPARYVVIEALEAVPSWHTKAKLLVSATQIRFDHGTAKALSKLLFRVKDIQDDRNEVIHGRWFTSSSAPGRWIHSPSVLGPMKAYDLACLTQIYDDIWDAMTELRKFFVALKERAKQISSVYAVTLQEMLAGFEPQQDENAADNELGGS
jgi:hypothetical protein